MAFAEDLTVFFDQQGGFAVQASFTPAGGGTQVSASVIFDSPTEDILGGDGLSDEYSITYPSTSLPGIKGNATGTVDGVSYKVREVKLLDDGKLKRAMLSKV